MNSYHRASAAVCAVGMVAVSIIAVGESGPGEPLGRSRTPADVVVTATATATAVETETTIATETESVTATETTVVTRQATPTAPPTGPPTVTALPSTPGPTPTRSAPPPTPTTTAPTPTPRNKAHGLDENEACLVERHYLLRIPCVALKIAAAVVDGFA